MDAFKILKMELPGIRSTLEDYTSGAIINHLDQLEIAMEEKDIISINYCLDMIDKWYHNNIHNIHSNSFVYNDADHDRSKQLISDLKTQMVEYVFPSSMLVESVQDTTPIVFLSHSSSDKKYGDALEKLLVGLGLKNNQLIYTSHPLHKIPLNANIYDYLRKNFNKRLFMIILWSDKYLDSPACLNEMGAAWVTQTDYTNIFTPLFHFGNPKFHECAVDTRKMGAILNGDEHCKANMIEFKNIIQEMFELENDEAYVSYLLDAFIKEIKDDVLA